jgi:hypothetical protein
MKRFTSSLLIVVLAMGVIAPIATAWGPEGRQAVSYAALQMLRREVSSAFRADQQAYEADLLRGARDGVEVVRESTPLANETQVMDAIDRQIQVLRTVRREGTGSFFAYRMGVLAAMTGNLVHPYGIIYDESDEAMQARIIADMERNIRNYGYTAKNFRFQYIRSPRLYFDTSRPFYSDDAKLIADDYRRGRGYNGFLSKGAEAYFQRSIEAVANVWFSVFYDGPDALDRTPSPVIMAEYYVLEIAYLLREKNNPDAARRAYAMFEQVNPGAKDFYIRIGDLFYEYGEDLIAKGSPESIAKGREMQDRGVHEWKIAQTDAGSARREASTRLSRHYIREGEFYFARSQQPNALDSDLNDALRNFSWALEFDRINDRAAARISETSLAIQRRQEKYALEDGFLSKSTEVMNVAERATVAGQFGDAIRAYNQALVTLGSISTDFKDLHQSAQDKISQVKNSLKEVMQKIQDEARAAMEAGQDAQLQNRFDDAIASFRRVPIILDAIPDDAGAVIEENKRLMIDEARELVADAESAKTRYQANEVRLPAPAGGANN